MNPRGCTWGRVWAGSEQSSLPARTFSTNVDANGRSTGAPSGRKHEVPLGDGPVAGRTRGCPGRKLS